MGCEGGRGKFTMRFHGVNGGPNAMEKSRGICCREEAMEVVRTTGRGDRCHGDGSFSENLGIWESERERERLNPSLGGVGFVGGVWVVYLLGHVDHMDPTGRHVTRSRGAPDQ